MRMWQPYALSALYLVTIKLGVFGNLWVICSVIRNTRPRTHSWSRLPSDRLRTYILVLALVDLIVINNTISCRTKKSTLALTCLDLLR
ncbi:unnamed protein product [Gongylonema pulchrum]|uniref:G_PROTEIN_RECEP_F1_2 domain-containing protein n=1 Tax=Gongylonema pulchrum TaxID=637853 RepID=A0A3P7ND82_9BILA|nr:unnamed protein product [Gongylonema pulchrum]